jgi:glycosyltransferase involved in cell wall biosynthesis
MSTTSLKISIVTPSYNQAPFLEDAMQSVLCQGDPNLEYVVIDGGSSDGSADIIRRYEQHLSYWTSEPDKGQYEAINKGFARTTGDVMAWLNSDDKYTSWAFSVVRDIFTQHPEVEWISTIHPLSWNVKGQAASFNFSGGFNRASFFRGGNLPTTGSYGRRYIQQESTFWRRSLWERAGSRLDTTFGLAADFELWARFYHHADLYGVSVPLGGFRAHGDQRSVLQANDYMAEGERILAQYGGRPCRGWEALMRGMLWKVARHYCLADLPRFVRAVTHRGGLTFPTKAVVWDGKEWRIISGFVM